MINMKRLVELTNILQQSTRYSHFLHTLDRSSCLATITGASLGVSVRLTVKSSELFPRDDQGMKTISYALTLSFAFVIIRSKPNEGETLQFGHTFTDHM